MWKEELCPGMVGILVTTNDQEKLCVPEAYNLLNEVYSVLVMLFTGSCLMTNKDQWQQLFFFSGFQ